LKYTLIVILDIKKRKQTSKITNFQESFNQTQLEISQNSKHLLIIETQDFFALNTTFDKPMPLFEEELCVLISKGKTKYVQQLLTNRLNINTMVHHKAPLFLACEKGLLDITIVLLQDKRIDVNLRNQGGKTALLRACEKGHVNIIRELLKHKDIDVNLKDDVWRSPLAIACESGKSEVVAELLKDSRVELNELNEFGFAPLHNSTLRNDCRTTKLLVSDQRCQINILNVTSQTSFYIACERGHIDIVNILLSDSRINVNLADSFSTTPFSRACANNQVEIVERLLKRKDIDVNLSNAAGQTPFFIACQNGHLEFVKLLLNDSRIDVKKCALDGMSPIAIACRSRAPCDIVELMLKDLRLSLTQIDEDVILMFLCKVCHQFGRFNLAQHILATGRQISQINLKPTQQFFNESDAEYISRKEGVDLIENLFLEYKKDPINIAFKIQRKLGTLGSLFIDFILF